MKMSFYIGMALGTVSTALVMQRNKVSKLIDKARRR